MYISCSEQNPTLNLIDDKMSCWHADLIQQMVKNGERGNKIQVLGSNNGP